MDDLVQQSRTLQGLPDSVLASLMQGGGLGATVPPFLVLGEVQRRKDLRAAANPTPAPTRTVAEDLMQDQAPVAHYAAGGRVGAMPNLYDPEYRRWWEEQAGAVPSTASILPRVGAPSRNFIGDGLLGGMNVPVDVGPFNWEGLRSIFNPPPSVNTDPAWSNANVARRQQEAAGGLQALAPEATPEPEPMTPGDWQMPTMAYPQIDPRTASRGQMPDYGPVTRATITPREGPSVDWAEGSRMPAGGPQSSMGYTEEQGPPEQSALSWLGQQGQEGIDAMNAYLFPPDPNMGMTGAERGIPGRGLPDGFKMPVEETAAPEEEPQSALAVLASPAAAAVPTTVQTAGQAAPEQEPATLDDYLKQAQNMRANDEVGADPYAAVRAKLAEMEKKAKDRDDDSLADFAIQAGLAMMASQNPNFLGAVGEGGLAGFQGYLDNRNRGDKEEMDRLQITAQIDEAKQRAAIADANGDRATALQLMQEARLREGQLAEMDYRNKQVGLEERKLGILASRATGAGKVPSEMQMAAMYLQDPNWVTAFKEANGRNPGPADAYKAYRKDRGTKDDPIAALMQQQEDQLTEDDLLGAL